LNQTQRKKLITTKPPNILVGETKQTDAFLPSFLPAVIVPLWLKLIQQTKMSHLIARNLAALSAFHSFSDDDTISTTLDLEHLKSLRPIAFRLLEQQNVELERLFDAEEPIDEAEFPLPSEYQVLDCIYNHRGLINLLIPALKTANYSLIKMIFDISKQGVGLVWSGHLLLLAVETRSAEIVKLFLNAGVHREPIKNVLSDALSTAVKYNSPEIVALLLPLAPSTFEYYSPGPLFNSAVMNGYTEIVNLFLEGLSNNHLRRMIDGAHIRQAAKSGHMDTVKALANCMDPEFAKHARIYIDYIRGGHELSDEEDTLLGEASDYLASLEVH
jgi:hypothetical protein